MKAVFAFLVLFAFLFSPRGYAEPRSPELLALDRYVGNWEDTTDEEVRISTTCAWVVEGGFLQHAWSLQAGKDKATSIGMQLMSYDSAQHAYRVWTFYPNGVAIEGKGTWDAAAKTFKWVSFDPATGYTTTSKATFVSDDQEDFVATTTDREGRLIKEVSRKKVRRK